MTAAAKKGWYDEVANMFSTDTGEKGTTKLFLVKVAVPNRVKGDRTIGFPIKKKCLVNMAIVLD